MMPASTQAMTRRQMPEISIGTAMPVFLISSIDLPIAASHCFDSTPYQSAAEQEAGDGGGDDRPVVHACECHGEVLPGGLGGTALVNIREFLACDHPARHTLVRLISLSSSSRVTGTWYSATASNRPRGK